MSASSPTSRGSGSQRASRQRAATVGWREWIAFPELGIDRVKAKIDTGARSSSLHATKLQFFSKRRERWVRFEVHPEQRASRSCVCEALVLDERKVRSSNGKQEHRTFITTLVRIGEFEWPIELSLTSRAEMGFRALLGRQAIRGTFLVDPGRSYVASRRRLKRVATTMGNE